MADIEMTTELDLGEPRHRTPRRRWRTAVLCVLLTATGAGAALAGQRLLGPGDETPPAQAGPVATVEVIKEALVESATVKGRLDYGKPVPLAVPGTGTVTWLPPVGAQVKRGAAVLRLDERPVVLCYGAIPMYRPLTAGVKGPDVEQFERNLRALGYDGFDVDERYSESTVAAVKRWQKETDRPATGAVQPGQVVFVPGPIRIAERLARLGAANDSDIVTYTDPAKTVTVDAKADQTDWATKGRKVEVLLPNGKKAAGTVASVGAAATEPAPDGQPAATAAPVPTVAVIVKVADQQAVQDYESGPVQVRYVERERSDVLTVPVVALLALAEGGYGVEIVEGAATRIVAVEVGMFTDARVEVRSPELRPGLRVSVTP
jgi:peptidoglycan hydrolase-like protein with peptidoglycan-binding domain